MINEEVIQPFVDGVKGLWNTIVEFCAGIL